MKYLLCLIYILFINACTSTTIEVVSIPSIKPWDLVKDEHVYKYDESLESYIELGSVDLSLILSNYETKYRGSSILGIEMNHLPDSVFDSDEIKLSLGVTPKKNVDISTRNITLVVNIDGVESYIKPYKVFRYSPSVFCGFDRYALTGNSYNSVEVNNDKDELLVGSGYKDNCYNLFFKFTRTMLNADFAVEFKGSLLPLEYERIYFHKKIIMWRTSN
ncbi:hypothetical protein HWQ46_26890 [Shewanella sp. D64]|uniref:hypothetical protein n=1 Tax=unclassified Shewanella TaxID=196818 RepID=UPI0022BA2176|nr:MULTISPECIES: hypothetical protein [unclassified Shewanella]MEC4729132.1 hypothetical protein [Shewanella sp. D64]MEC4740914.1 hypothetical protein [Shewanella sp. E94]WBJ96245.1 hypothetical protein HWQ47_03705 [Shewanella sp. MTB7]